MDYTTKLKSCLAEIVGVHQFTVLKFKNFPVKKLELPRKNTQEIKKLSGYSHAPIHRQ